MSRNICFFEGKIQNDPKFYFKDDVPVIEFFIETRHYPLVKQNTNSRDKKQNSYIAFIAFGDIARSCKDFAKKDRIQARCIYGKHEGNEYSFGVLEASIVKKRGVIDNPPPPPPPVRVGHNR